MKRFLLAGVFLCSVVSNAQNDDIKNTITTFFEGFHKRDTAIIHSVCRNEMVLHSVSVSPKGEKFTVETADELYKSIVSIPKDFIFEEKILSYNIQVDGPMAHVWTPYEFHIKGKLSHSGVNSFQLVKDNGKWKIAYICDTRRR